MRQVDVVVIHKGSLVVFYAVLQHTAWHIASSPVVNSKTMRALVTRGATMPLYIVK
jgi:hypothetical protein